MKREGREGEEIEIRASSMMTIKCDRFFPKKIDFGAMSGFFWKKTIRAFFLEKNDPSIFDGDNQVRR